MTSAITSRSGHPPTPESNIQNQRTARTDGHADAWDSPHRSEVYSIQRPLLRIAHSKTEKLPGTRLTSHVGACRRACSVGTPLMHHEHPLQRSSDGGHSGVAATSMVRRPTFCVPPFHPSVAGSRAHMTTGVVCAVPRTVPTARSSPSVRLKRNTQFPTTGSIDGSTVASSRV